MNKLDQFLKLAEEHRWEEALPIIQEVVKADMDIPTSWFNWGVCLQELKRFADAVTAFKTCYNIDPTDYNCQYRIFLNLALAEDKEGFFSFLEAEYKEHPEIIQLISEAPEFTDLVLDARFNTYITPDN